MAFYEEIAQHYDDIFMSRQLIVIAEKTFLSTCKSLQQCKQFIKWTFFSPNQPDPCYHYTDYCQQTDSQKFAENIGRKPH